MIFSTKDFWKGFNLAMKIARLASFNNLNLLIFLKCFETPIVVIKLEYLYFFFIIYFNFEIYQNL